MKTPQTVDHGFSENYIYKGNTLSNRRSPTLYKYTQNAPQEIDNKDNFVAHFSQKLTLSFLF